jgi:hypothetical protein
LASFIYASTRISASCGSFIDWGGCVHIYISRNPSANMVSNNAYHRRCAANYNWNFGAYSAKIGLSWHYPGTMKMKKTLTLIDLIFQL